MARLREFLPLLTTVLVSTASIPAYAQSSIPGDPIAFVGHGALFGSAGNQIEPTARFIAGATRIYITSLSQNLSADQRAEFTALERSLTEGLSLDEQARLIVNTRLIDWLIERAPRDVAFGVRPKNNAIKALLRVKLAGTGASDPRSGETDYELPDALHGRLMKLRKSNVAQKKANPALLDVTVNSGEAYRLECASKGVPIPPDFGPSSAWVKRGTINKADLFIARGMDADVLTYTSLSPKGICVALPRYDAQNVVQLDGVICLGLDTSNVCFFDNQTGPGGPDRDDTFTFENGSAQPFSRWAGGTDLYASNGGICTDCHAGENPYIIHGTVLNTLRRESVIMPPQQYTPLVKANDGENVWPQNVGSLDAPAACSDCHDVLSDGGRLPRLSQSLPKYCNTILRSALGALMPPAPSKPLNAPAAMPPKKPGTLACTPGLPAADPRYAACSAATTEDCTPKLDCTLAEDVRDSRCALPDFPAAYKVRCTPDVKSLFVACERL
ncbi:hypothetical protein C2U70_12475 [Bradyrhizobium guangdongense]|uniref:hypothetical protein n=1 Tax=Bradyrhizobium guangdongense TaxID=1325090 RepID=UPI00112A8AFC|nr:hypothetical protein [Bradyrhizobium guangdongense]TPQ36612.1 hypothetical protein C2U70_12475 [Bradyrhizobium guangdongense]